VEVTHSQNDSHDEVDCCCCNVALAIKLKGLDMSAGNTSMICLLHPQQQVLETVILCRCLVSVRRRKQ